MDEKDLIFLFKITNPEVIKNIIDIYHKNGIISIPFYLKEEGITFRASTTKTNKKQQFISDVEIYTDDILEYYLNHEKCRVKEEGNYVHIIQMDVKTLKEVLKSLSKDGSILSVYQKCDEDKVSINIISNTTETTEIKEGDYQHLEIDFGEFPEKPNYKLKIKDFCTGIKSLTRGRPENIHFTIYNGGAIAKSENTGNRSSTKWVWGEIPGDEDSGATTSINAEIIKSIQKIDSLSISGIIKLFSNEDGNLKIYHKLGDFGEHQMYFLNID